MTSVELNSIKNGVLAMPNLFAHSASGLDITPIPATDDNSEVAFDTGYPAAYDNAGQNPKTVERAKMNWLLRVLSQGSFFGQTGIRYTYNDNVANAIGGYPLGAVLAHDDGISIRNVVSLKDDNKYNFLTNGVDDKNWRYLDSYDNAGIFPDYGQCGYLIYATLQQNTPKITQMCEWVPMPENGWLYPQFNLVKGVTTYLVLGPADGTVPSNVVFTGDVYQDMITPSDDNASEQGINEMPYSIFLLGNNYYSNKNLIPVKKGTKMAVFGKNTSGTLVNMAGVWIRMYRNYYR